MSGELTPGELARRLTRLEADSVSSDVYERDLRELKENIGEIRDSLTWAMRLIVGQFVSLVLALLLFLAQNNLT